MNKNIFAAVGFVVGAAVGSVTTWYLVRTKYKAIADEEIQSVIDEFKGYRMPEALTDEEYEELKGDAEPKNAAPVDYTTYSNAQVDEVVADEEPKPSIKPEDPEKPYIITPAEYGELEGYGTVTLTFYKDHILADEENDILENVEEMIGFESLNHFGEYVENAVYVRNDKVMCDFEILTDEKTYQESLDDEPIRKGVL